MVSPSLSTRGGLTPATEAYAAFCSARRVQMCIRRLVRISRLPCATGTWVLCLGIEAHLQFGIRFRVEYAQLGKFHAFPVCPRLLVSSIPRYEYEANDGLHGGHWRGGETITAGL